jgi:alpha-tubulin suppressor-like RCC1 family protein
MSGGYFGVALRNDGHLVSWGIDDFRNVSNAP